MAVFGGRRITRAGILFIIGVVLLAGLVAGAVLLVQNRGETTRRDEAVKIAEQKLKEESEVVRQPIASDPVDKTETETGTGTETDNTTESAPVAGTADPGALPETGPGLDSFLIVTILALSVAFYVSSRRGSQHL